MNNTRLSATFVNDTIVIKRVLSVRPIITDLEVVVKPVIYDGSLCWENKFFKGTQYIGMASTANFENGENNFLHGVEVIEPFQNMGYGAAIVSYMITKYGVDTLYVEPGNHAALKIYRKYGFKIVDWFFPKDRAFFVMHRGD